MTCAFRPSLITRMATALHAGLGREVGVGVAGEGDEPGLRRATAVVAEELRERLEDGRGAEVLGAWEAAAAAVLGGDLHVAVARAPA